MSLIRPEAQAIIDRLAKIDQTTLRLPQIERVASALEQHLLALKQPMRPIRWIMGLKEGMVYVSKRAEDAAWNAAWNAARGAARDAAWNAARDAAWNAARDAAWNAAWGAAWDAAWNAARGVAWDAAWDAAWGAAITNSCYDFPEFNQWKSVWVPLTAAFESGLFIYWVTPNEIIATPQPMFRFRGGQLHGDGVPAIKYPNGECYYYWRGVKVPDEWGSVSSEHWRPEWLLEATNAEHRRALLQGLGYERVKAALPTTVLHTDRDMELVRIAKEVDVEPIVVLKVVCPSTDRPYVLRVPPTMTTCESARRWTLHDEQQRLALVVET